MVSPTARITMPFFIAKSLHSEPALGSISNRSRFDLSLQISIAATSPFALASPTIGWSASVCHSLLK